MRRGVHGLVWACATALAALLLAGCPTTPPGNGDSGADAVVQTSPAFNNTTDPTNGGATLVGAAACGACHPDIAKRTQPHDHTTAGVDCEACHGPGSNHLPHPSVRNIYVDSTVKLCARCHTGSDDPRVIAAADGYIKPNAQYAELRASGGHASFSCTYCHDPHASAKHDRTQGIRNECAACHGDMNRAFHDKFTFMRGEYVEPLDCESCHMPFTGLRGTPAGHDVVADYGGRMGDVRGHIFRIDTERTTYAAMFTADGTRVLKDAQGRATITPDFVCLRCHSGVGSAFMMSPAGGAAIGTDMHAHAAAAE